LCQLGQAHTLGSDHYISLPPDEHKNSLVVISQLYKNHKKP
jgi:hypothetical protein